MKDAQSNLRSRVEQNEHPIHVLNEDALRIMARLGNVPCSDDGKLDYPGGVKVGSHRVIDVRIDKTVDDCAQVFSFGLSDTMFCPPPRSSMAFVRLSEGSPWELEYIGVFGKHIGSGVSIEMPPLKQLQLIQEQLGIFTEIADACEADAAAGEQSVAVPEAVGGNC